MKSKVFFTDMSTKKFRNDHQKIETLINKCGIDKIFDKNEIVAIKIHFGEFGNTAFIRPTLLHPIVNKLNQLKTKPFLTDTNTLYVGMRTNSVDHLKNANMNGFGYSTLQIPIIIADGLRGENTLHIKTNGKHTKSAYLASDIINADAMIVLSHFKGHEVSGFGGAIKNLSMGCASRQGKMDMHSSARPYVEQDKCTACGRCIKSCQVSAISINQQKASISDKCVGCSRCIAVCPEVAIQADWNATSDKMQMKMVEYAKTVNDKFKNKIIYVNIVTHISPACDCAGGNDEPVVKDIGFLSSTDPLAIDKAAFDLVKATNNSIDPFKETYPHLNTEIQLNYGAETKLGNIEYDLITL